MITILALLLAVDVTLTPLDRKLSPFAGHDLWAAQVCSVDGALVDATMIEAAAPIPVLPGPAVKLLASSFRSQPWLARVGEAGQWALLLATVLTGSGTVSASQGLKAALTISVGAAPFIRSGLTRVAPPFDASALLSGQLNVPPGQCITGLLVTKKVRKPVRIRFEVAARQPLTSIPLSATR